MNERTCIELDNKGEIAMEPKNKRCKIKLEKDPTFGWRLSLEGDCSRELEIVAGLTKGRRRYVEKRLQK